MKMRVLELFLNQTEEKSYKSVIQFAQTVETKNRKRIEAVFQEEGAAIPIAFTEKDIDKSAPRLFDDNFQLMFIRLLSKILIGLYALHSGMSYREDIYRLYNDFTKDSMEIYNRTTQILLEKGVLVRPPGVPMPEKAEFVQGKSYLGGLNPFAEKRVLNTVEIGLIYQALESNITGVQLMTGFAQAAENPEVKQYFIRGRELAQKIVSVMSGLLTDSDLPAPSTWAGTVTASQVPPLSDKIMMYATNLLSMFGMGSNSVGAAFGFRGDLVAKMGKILVETFDFAKEGGKIMIEHGWMEEPPQAADRKVMV
jgi:hypothetical protein